MTWLEPDENFCPEHNARIVGNNGEKHPCPFCEDPR